MSSEPCGLDQWFSIRGDFIIWQCQHFWLSNLGWVDARDVAENSIMHGTFPPHPLNKELYDPKY